MKTCQRCNITGTTVFTVPGRGDWHPGCWRLHKRAQNNKLAPHHVKGSRLAQDRFRLNRVAHGYVVIDRKTDAKVCFRLHKSDAVWQLRQCRQKFMCGQVT
jgi:hypothetical protein